jgi:hypothetical protein
MNNCYCNTTQVAYTTIGTGGYMLFEDFGFIQKHFNVVIPWALGCAVGSVSVLLVAAFSFGWWKQCRGLWRTNQRGRPTQLQQVRIRASTVWLQ